MRGMFLRRVYGGGGVTLTVISNIADPLVFPELSYSWESGLPAGTYQFNVGDEVYILGFSTDIIYLNGQRQSFHGEHNMPDTMMPLSYYKHTMRKNTTIDINYNQETWETIFTITEG